jgi:hypothetical protein
VVFAGSVSAGGALMMTTAVENVPRFPTGIQDLDLMAGMRAQPERFGVRIIDDDTVAVDPKYAGLSLDPYLNSPFECGRACVSGADLEGCLVLKISPDLLIHDRRCDTVPAVAQQKGQAHRSG